MFTKLFRGGATRLPLLAVGLLTACSGLGTGAVSIDPAEPIALTYPYGETGAALFAGYEQVAAGAAPSYVAVTIIADRETARQAGKDLVNAASGTIVDPRGYIVTASHIAIDDKYSANVTTIDGRVHRGEILNVDRASELAVIKIPAAAVPAAARLADSSALAAGDHTVAIGTVRERKGVVSLGQVKEPRLEKELSYNGYTIAHPLVLSMKVAYGNSGGPVFNQRGELIGMVASLALYKPDIAFAVPSNDIAAHLQAVIIAE